MENNDTMNSKGRAERAAYYRKWRRDNPDKVKAINRRYWEKKAAAADQGKGAEA